MTSDNTKDIVNPDGTLPGRLPRRGRALPLDARPVHRLQRAARRPRHQGQALVLRLLRQPAGLLLGRRRRLDEPADRRPRPHRPLLRQAQLADQPQAQAGRHLPPGRQGGRQRPERSTPRPARRSRGRRRRRRPASATRASSRTGRCVEVRYSGFYGDVKMGPTDPNQPRDLNRFYDIDTGFISGGHYYWYDLGPKRTTVTAKVSHLADNFLGASHDFRFGVQYSDAQRPRARRLQRPHLHLQPDRPRLRLRHRTTRRSATAATPAAIGVFFDDTVRVNDRLSLNLGAPLRLPEGLLRRAGPARRERQPHRDHLPRDRLLHLEHASRRGVGFNWKLTGDGKTVLKGHYGRYHRAVATGEYANKLGPEHHADLRGPLRHSPPASSGT